MFIVHIQQLTDTLQRQKTGSKKHDIENLAILQGTDVKKITFHAITKNKKELLSELLFACMVAHIGLEPMTYRLSPCRSPN